MIQPKGPTVSLRSRIAAALTDCPHTLEHDRVELRYGPGQQGGNTLSQILTRLEAAFAAAHPAEQQEGDAAGEKDAAEGARIISDLIQNIEQDGMYSQEATLTFLTQALHCLPPPYQDDDDAAMQAMKGDGNG